MREKLMQHRKKALIILLSVLLFTATPSIGQAVGKFAKQMAVIQEVYELIAEYHVSNVDPDVLMQGAINGMIESLNDPFTEYFTAEEYEMFRNSIDGSFTGIGIYIAEKDDYIVVQSPISGSPAEQTGIISGDLIIGVDGKDIKGMTTNEVSNLIKGEEGTSVELTIKRGEQVLKFEVKRAKITLPLITTEMLAEDIGYLRLYSFGSNSPAEFKNELNNLQKQGMKKLVLDLRGNPGGYLDAVLEISENFIEDGPIVYVKDNKGQEQELSISGGAKWDLPIVILINNSSASASEILAGALQDYNKATVVGQNSFGKGSVQHTLQLENGGYLKLTFYEYFTPDKRKINGIGVKPDFEVLDPNDQLNKAIELLGGNKQYRVSLGEQWIKESDNNYIALRPLIEFYNGKVTWDSQNNIIEVQLNSGKVHLKNNADEVLIKNGMTYINVNKLKELFPELMIEQKDDIIIIYIP